MRVLIIHNETRYFAGAQKMLGYFLEEISAECDLTIALAENIRTKDLIPARIRTVSIPGNQTFSILGLQRQVREILKIHRELSFDVVHGWTARDWELTALSGLLMHRPTIGTLHDHPTASFISSQRQRLMRWTARWGLKRIICVSEAVSQACKESAFPSSKLSVIHNGLPPHFPATKQKDKPPFRIGYLGVLSERKGVGGLFEIVNSLEKNDGKPWELYIAGKTQDAAGEALVKRLKHRYCTAEWWPRVKWFDWVNDPLEFLRSLNILILPSMEFDPFPTVLLEAGRSGIPAIAARVGGVPEIIDDGKTGWLFEAGDWKGAADKLNSLMLLPLNLQQAGRKASEKVDYLFSTKKMIASYLNLYLSC